MTDPKVQPRSGRELLASWGDPDFAAPDAKADAKMLGPDRTAALVAAIWDIATGTEPTDLMIAARRLAAPEAAEPVWPERVWAVFNDGGRWARATHTLDEAHAYRGEGYTILPAHLVPLDGSRVVLDRTTAERLLFMAGDAVGHPDRARSDKANRLWCALKDALDRARADTEGT